MRSDRGEDDGIKAGSLSVSPYLVAVVRLTRRNEYLVVDGCGEHGSSVGAPVEWPPHLMAYSSGSPARESLHTKKKNVYGHSAIGIPSSVEANELATTIYTSRYRSRHVSNDGGERHNK